MRKLLLALAMTALTYDTSAAANLEIDDLLGRWCGDVANYTFSRTQLSVVRLDGKKLAKGPVLTIAKTEGRADQIDVYWLPVKKADNFTRFELSTNKRLLIQLPNADEDGKAIGDKGPRREFRRC
jgi:hypothetical protein